MDTLALKLVLTPALIGAASLAGRRWGPTVSGWERAGIAPAFAAALTVVLGVQGLALSTLRGARTVSKG